jgi:hypothetical protein
MKIAEEQKKQFIVLCCLVVFVFAYAVVKLVGSSSNAQTRQTKAVTKQIDKSTVTDNRVDTPETATEVVASDAAVDQSARDPFIPQVVPDDNNSSTTAGRIKTTFPPMLPTGQLSGLGPLVPPMGFGQKITVGTANPGTGQVEQEQDPAKLLKLTGIVQGSTNVAILRGPNNARYIVREGQVIDGKYRVDMISRYGVRLSFNKRIYLLSLGGSDANNGA